MSTQWSFVFEEGLEDEPETFTGLEQRVESKPLQLAPKKQDSPAPLKLTRSQPTPTVKPVPCTIVDDSKSKNTKWNFTGARLKPHVVGVHFDKHSQYMGNWKGGTSPSKKRTKKNTGNSIQTRPLTNVKRSLKLSGNRISAPGNYANKADPKRRSGSQHYVSKPDTNAANTKTTPHQVLQRTSATEHHRVHTPPQDLPQIRSQFSGQQGNYAPYPYREYHDSYQQSHRHPHRHPQFIDSPNQNSYAPEPLYRSVSMPQSHEPVFYNNNQHGSNRYPPSSQPQPNELLDLLDFSLPERQTIQRHSSLSVETTHSASNFDFSELEYDQNTRVQPTHVYFNEETSYEDIPRRFTPEANGNPSTNSNSYSVRQNPHDALEDLFSDEPKNEGDYYTHYPPEYPSEYRSDSSYTLQHQQNRWPPQSSTPHHPHEFSHHI